MRPQTYGPDQHGYFRGIITINKVIKNEEKLRELIELSSVARRMEAKL